MNDNTSGNAVETKKKSKALRWLCIIGIAVLLGLGVTFIILIPFFRGDFYVSSTGIYSREMLPQVEASDSVKKTNVWKEQESDYCGIEYRYIYYSGQAETVDQCIKYHEFKNRRQARKAYNMMKKNGYEPIGEEGSNYFIGWEKGVMDASIEQIVCLSGKLIITAVLETASEWATSPDDTTPRSFAYPERKQYILQNYAR